MAQITYRGNLSAKSFPMISENFGRSIIVKQYDQNFSRQSISPEDSDKDIGIPQIYYCHNVMPHEDGVQSIGYTEIIAAASGYTGDFIYTVLLRSIASERVLLGVTSTGELWTNDGTGWVYRTFVAAGKRITTAYVNGVTYIYVANNGCIAYDFSTSTFVPVALAGLVAADILGICASFGYMIAWTSSAVYWSSTIDPTDFVPSLATGAGGGSVESAKGALAICVPQALGFIVGTEDNAVVAIYSGNSRYPFNFRELVNSGGLTSLDLVSWDANSTNLYAYTTSGLQTISSSQTQTVYPEITDFISGRLFEDFDDTTKTFIETTLSSPMMKKVSVIADRYLIMSYGITELTHAIVFDLALKRYGKLKITHVQAFTYHIVSTGITEIPRQSVAFLQKNGKIVVVDFSISSTALNGTLILGKYQFVRQRNLIMDEIILESIRTGQSLTLTLMTSLYGKTTVNTTPYLAQTDGLQRSYNARSEGVNHSILFQGGFMLDSFVLKFSLGAKR